MCEMSRGQPVLCLCHVVQAGRTLAPMPCEELIGRELFVVNALTREQGSIAIAGKYPGALELKGRVGNEDY